MKLKEIKNAIKKTKDKFWRAKSRYIKYYENLPIKKKTILLESEHGKKLNGNMYYIIKYLASNEEYNDYEIYISSMGRFLRKFRSLLNQAGLQRVKLVMLASDEYMQLLASAEYLFNDTTFGTYFMKKNGQKYINTWHGTPLKCLGKSVKAEMCSIGNIQKNFVMSDYLMYPNEYTMRHMVEDYMLENISKAQIVYCGYPRNEIFFDTQKAEEIRAELELEDKRVYAYLPTFRGRTANSGDVKSQVYLAYHLFELDNLLADDEIFFVNLHPLAKKSVDFKHFKHIKEFPAKYETYEFLNSADVLVTDYSSVFFDFACSKKKIVLFTYDIEDYLEDRGLYFSMDELPFPQVKDAPGLIKELRGGINYDDTEFMNTYCPYENINASKKLCDYTILGKDTGLKTESIPNNNKENVLIYAGNLASNGITTSIRNLLGKINTEERNYYLTFKLKNVKGNETNLPAFTKMVNYFAMMGDMNLTVKDRIIRKLFKQNVIKTPLYIKLMKKRMQQDFIRCFGENVFDRVIQFNGYENEVILGFSTFPGDKTIYVHNNMVREMQTRSNQRKDVLKYAYKHYDHIAAVTTDILEPTYTLVENKEKVVVAKNIIDDKFIRMRAEEEMLLDDFTKTSVSREQFFEAINSDRPKFISIGRFSPEKGHKRLVDAFKRVLNTSPDALLFIMGGNSLANGYGNLIKYIEELGISDSVILLLKVSNPYPVLKACDYFVLSSFYEGFGLVLAEADILGKPVISTDVEGPHGFMTKYGGTLVADSEDGIYSGMLDLLAGKIKPMNVDYDEYNKEAIAEFEAIMNK